MLRRRRTTDQRKMRLTRRGGRGWRWWISIEKSQTGEDYLHPALLNVRAYILPMSPMPMRPTAKSSAPGNGGGAVDDAVVDAIVSRPVGNKSRNANKNPSLPNHMVRPTANDFPRRLRAGTARNVASRVMQ